MPSKFSVLLRICSVNYYKCVLIQHVVRHYIKLSTWLLVLESAIAGGETDLVHAQIHPLVSVVDRLECLTRSRSIKEKGSQKLGCANQKL